MRLKEKPVFSGGPHPAHVPLTLLGEPCLSLGCEREVVRSYRCARTGLSGIGRCSSLLLLLVLSCTGGDHLRILHREHADDVGGDFQVGDGLVILGYDTELLPRRQWTIQREEIESFQRGRRALRIKERGG